MTFQEILNAQGNQPNGAMYQVDSSFFSLFFRVTKEGKLEVYSNGQQEWGDCNAESVDELTNVKPCESYEEVVRQRDALIELMLAANKGQPEPVAPTVIEGSSVFPLSINPSSDDPKMISDSITEHAVSLLADLREQQSVSGQEHLTMIGQEIAVHLNSFDPNPIRVTVFVNDEGKRSPLDTLDEAATLFKVKDPDAPESWTTDKPPAPGFYLIRGNGLPGVHAVRVFNRFDDVDCLRVNLHSCNTEEMEPETAWGFDVETLNKKFEWLGPLCAVEPNRSHPIVEID